MLLVNWETYYVKNDQKGREEAQKTEQPGLSYPLGEQTLQS